MSTDAVYQIMLKNIRPLNMTDITSRLPSGTSKTAIKKSLDKLISQKKIFEKVYSKQKIYCITQDKKYDKNVLLQKTQEYQLHEENLLKTNQDLKNELLKQKKILNTLKNSSTIEEAIVKINELKENIKIMDKKLKKCMETDTKNKDIGAEKKLVQKNEEIYSREYIRRKKLATDVLDGIMEGYPGTKKQLYDDIGIEIVNIK